MLKAKWFKHTLVFNRPAGTSRGVLNIKDSYFIKLTHTSNKIIAWGECGVLKGLSYDDRSGYEEKLTEVCSNINNAQNYLISGLKEWPSIYFGLEMALRDYETGGNRHLFQNKFTAGIKPIPINGLIWMGSYDFMHAQIQEKLSQGFKCLKLKIGALNFSKEVALLKLIRKNFSADQLELRVDANGAFNPLDVREKLVELSQFNLHSIEQPIAVNQWTQMTELCAQNIIPIALDEELIGITDITTKRNLLEQIKPQYIILKPSLIGGFKGSLEWINLAKRANINWWVTSALESNLGLNAIAQWTASLDNDLPQGLGTGNLYNNNIPSPLKSNKGFLYHDINSSWNLSNIE